jgi:hypothetical protein
MGLALVASLCAAACGGSSTPQSETASETPAADASHQTHTTPGKVFFVEPKDGSTLKAGEVKVVFGSDQVTIAPVPTGEIKEADVRPNTVHYHIAVDTDCLPAGQVIPKAHPWTHFGDGSNSADLSLTPGKYRLTVQAGDDMHRTIEGLCETIAVNVTE